MRKFLEDWEWEDTWYLLFYSVAVTFYVCLVVYMFSTERVVEYSLEGGEGQKLMIEKHVDWNYNNSIELDRSVTVWEATRMVDSLNRTVRK